MTTVLEPIWVADSGDSAVWPPLNVDAIRVWATGQGIDLVDTFRVEVYLIDGPVGRVYEWDKNEYGYRYCPVDHNCFDEPQILSCEIAQRKPYDVLLSSLPPALELT